MARYFVGDGTSTAWNHDPNWNSTDGGSYPGDSVEPTASDDTIFNGNGTGNLTLTAAAVCASLTHTAAYSGNFDANDQNLTASGAVVLAGTGSYSWGSGTITIDGNFTFSTLLVANWSRQTSTFKFMASTGNTTISSATAGGSFAQWFTNVTIDSGANKVSWTAGAGLNTYNDAIITGEFEVTAGMIWAVSGVNSTLTINASSELSGLGEIRLLADAGITPLTNNGTISIARFYYMAAFNDSTGVCTATTYGGDLALIPVAASTCGLILGPGTFNVPGKFKVINANVATTFTIDANTNDPDINIGGDVAFATPYTVVWAVGSGTITLDGTGSQDIDFNGYTIENLVIAKASGTATLTNDVSPASFTGTSGTLDSNGYDITATNDMDWASGFVISDPVDSTFVVGGNFTADGQNISSASGEWFLQVTGTAVAIGTGDVTFSNAIGFTEIDASSGPWSNSGANFNWDFGITRRTARMIYLSGAI
jgi:hypothetical protein